jgi:hypothetical protein
MSERKAKQETRSGKAQPEHGGASASPARSGSAPVIGPERTDAFLSRMQAIQSTRQFVETDPGSL